MSNEEITSLIILLFTGFASPLVLKAVRAFGASKHARKAIKAAADAAGAAMADTDEMKPAPNDAQVTQKQLSEALGAMTQVMTLTVAFKTELDNARDEIKACHQQRAAVNDELKAQAERIAQQQQTITGLETRLRHAEDARDTLEQQLKSVQATLTNRIASDEAAAQKQHETMTTMQIQIKERDETIASLRAEVARLTAIVDRLRTILRSQGIKTDTLAKIEGGSGAAETKTEGE